MNEPQTKRFIAENKGSWCVIDTEITHFITHPGNPALLECEFLDLDEDVDEKSHEQSPVE